MTDKRLDRRMFLKGSGLTLAGFGLTSLLPTPLIRQAMAAGMTNGKRLVFIFQRGANDGLNTLIPHGDPDYNTTNRPTLYIAPEDAIDLNGFISMHPALSDLTEMFNAGDLAAIHRVGYPNMTRSHFDGQVIWENGNPSQALMAEGWLYRYMREHADARSGNFPAVASPYGGILITGENNLKVEIANPDNFDYSAFNGRPEKDKYKAGWREHFTTLSALGRYRSLGAETGLSLMDMIDEYATWDQANWHPRHPNTGDYLFPVDDATNPIDPDGPNGLRFASGFYPFFKSLKVVALSLLESDPTSPNGTRIAGSQLDGHDTHENQGQISGAQARLLEALAYGISSLRIALSGQATNEPRGYASIWEDTVVITMSEFGRTSRENGSFGTDHGNAVAVFAAGGSINGGVYNGDASTWDPGVIFGDEGRDLAERSDYRAVFWEILRDHMGADPATVDTIFPGYSSMGLQEIGLIP